MEKIYQSVSSNGLQIPIAIMRQYGLEPGAAVVLELQPEGIRIEPARAEAAMIEKRALRYLLAHLGDAATASVHPLPDGAGWQVDVYGVGMTRPAGKLIYSTAGILQPEQSTPPADMRRSVEIALAQS